MKFSFSLIKKLVPKIKDKKEFIQKMNEFSFESEDLGGNVVDVSIPANRFSDAASHFGIATEISAILGKKYQIPDTRLHQDFGGQAKYKILNVVIKDKDLCSRYAGQYFDNVKVGESPKWLKDILIDCGLRPINNVVDIMNYAMLETGQPLHAFDFDKLKTIVVRRAKKGEKITTLDNQNFDLNENILVIADSKHPLAIAGIKGGKSAEVDKNTKKIIVEAANFKGVNIYKSSKVLKLQTDASLRFAHNISPELVLLGLNSAAKLLRELAGAKAGQITDVNYTKEKKKIIKFDWERFNKLIGINLDIKTCFKYLENLGFKVNKNSLIVEIPPIRKDIELFEDLAEEIIRIYGFNKLKSIPPKVHLSPSGFEDSVVLKDKLKKILSGFGFNEIYNYSFVSGESGQMSVEIDNPISAEFKYLRQSLSTYLIKNIKDNFRFFNEVKIFEIGKTFTLINKAVNEKTTLGLVLASKNKKGEVFFELKGYIEKLFKKIGLVDYIMPEAGFEMDYLINGEILKIKSAGQNIGYIGRVNKNLIGNREGVLAELDLEALLKLVEEEREYRPLPKYPSVMRDISILVEPSARVGEIIQAIQEVNLKIIEDADLIDEFEYAKALTNGHTRITRSLTFRIIFQAENKTLTDEEVNKEMVKIEKVFKSDFGAEIR